MKVLAGVAVLLFAGAACQGSGNSSVDNANKILKAPDPSSGAPVDSNAQAPMEDKAPEVKAPRPEIARITGFMFKEIRVDPKDNRSRLDLVRTLLGEEWLPMSKTPKGDGVVVWKFMRRDGAAVDIDPFDIPDLFKATKEPPKPIK